MSTDTEMPAYLTLDEVATRLRVSRWTVSRLIHSGQIRASKIGQQWRIDPSDLTDDVNDTANRPRRRRRAS